MVITNSRISRLARKLVPPSWRALHRAPLRCTPAACSSSRDEQDPANPDQERSTAKQHFRFPYLCPDTGNQSINLLQRSFHLRAVCNSGIPLYQHVTNAINRKPKTKRNCFGLSSVLMTSKPQSSVELNAATQ